jgi:ribosome-associated protein
MDSGEPALARAACYSTAAVEDLEVTSRLTIPGQELSVRFARSGGPGGQHVNKTESKVELRWRPADSRALTGTDREWLLPRLAARLTGDGDLIVTSERTRDQARNRQDALDKLAAIVRAALVRPKPRRRTRPTRGAVERRIGEKKRRGRTKQIRRERPGE